MNKLYVTHQDSTREFKSQYGKTTISRLEYEELPIPMVAEEFSDEKMQRLVDNINLSMRSEYDEDELLLLEKYRRTSPNCNLTQEEINRADRMSEREFEHFENCATELGMRYLEDLNEEEQKTLTEEIEKAEKSLLV